MSLKPFVSLTSVAAPFTEAQIDTDVIFPARFLLLLDKHGLGKHLFHERRAKGGFVLDTPPWNKAQILVTGPDFGTGSSREQAVWSLVDYGIRCIIGPSFGEIFFANCFRNGVLPIVLTGEPLEQVTQAAQSGHPITVDLKAEQIVLDDGTTFSFSIEAHRKRALIEGLDAIGVIFEDDMADITAYEAAERARRPWLFLNQQQFSHFDDIKDTDHD